MIEDSKLVLSEAYLHQKYLTDDLDGHLVEAVTMGRVLVFFSVSNLPLK